MKVGREIAASERWREAAPGYVATIDSPYHRHRIEVIRRLLPDPIGKTVIDFGCGQGVLLVEALVRGAETAIGIDIDPTMVAEAEKIKEATVLHGGVERLSECRAADCIIAANVLAYMTDAEEQQFYICAARLLRPGGSIVITHSRP
ncbi:MAG TPA: class I SAM-dependent methyltransferase [Stellaceae bacterium]|nr:class I SAM-dependent methyltransferase [Stellaceae bacterium]